MRRRQHTFAALLILLAAMASAADFYVKPNGNDALAGTSEETAFATIQRGVDALKPGDALLIAPGIYRECVRREGLGSDDAVTTIRAQKPGTVELRGAVEAVEKAFRKAVGYRFIYVKDFVTEDTLHAVNELDTFKVLQKSPNLPLLDFTPGAFWYDRAAGKLYISSSDLAPIGSHLYSLSVNNSHGLYLNHAQRVTIEGLEVSGFHGSKLLSRLEGTMGATYGIFLQNCREVTIRNCNVSFNGGGIGINSEDDQAGHNLVEDCSAYANATNYCWGDPGGITIHGQRRGNSEIVRNCKAFANKDYGINIYSGTGEEFLNEERRNLLIDNIAWDNGIADFKIKTGHDYSHRAIRCIGPGLWSLNDPQNCLIGRLSREVDTTNIVLANEEDLDPAEEFVDPAHLDYRLTATSRFRGTGPNGTDRGPLPYEESATGAPQQLLRKPAPPAKLVGPFLYSATATTANLEWWVSLPGEYAVTWTDGTNQGHTETVESAMAGTYSLTGLQPDTAYTFHIRSAEVESDSLHFRTAATVHPPTTYYVANDGSDSQTGLSRELAFRTIQHAANQVQAGDTVLIAGGIYPEAVHLRSSGEEGLPITFQAIPGEKVVFDGLGRTLTYAFMGNYKHHLRFDALYFTGYQLTSPDVPYAYRIRGLNGAISLYRSSHVTVTRCFLDGRGPGYSPGLVTAIHCPDVTVRNCAIVGAMGGGLTVYWDSPRMRVEHNVFLRNLISQTLLQPYRWLDGEKTSLFSHNIVTDGIPPKVFAALTPSSESVRSLTNCYYVRLKPEERKWNNAGDYFLNDFLANLAAKEPTDHSLAADPGFAGAAGLELISTPEKPRLYSDLMVGKESLDFTDLFATNPDVVNRDIGLQPSAFEDFHFHQETSP